MSSAPRHGIGSIVALFACVIVSQAALAQAPPAGVFSELQTALIARPSTMLEPATVRSRVVQVDTQKITAARRGREVLKLNLFDDAVVEVQIKRVRPTRSGYFISGRPKGMEWGAVRLVVNGPVMVGTVETPEGTFTIRSGGSGRHIIRQIDPSAEAFECEVEEGPAPVRPEQAISSIGPLGSLALPPTPQADDVPTEDGSEIRVLIVYTPAVQAAQGGAAGMRALINLLIQSANQAFEDGGINPRLVLAHSAKVDYVGQTTGIDLARLKNPEDGYMDEVHGLRNQYAADLVHLLTRRGGGSAWRLTSETLSGETGAAFAVTGNGSERTFTHEIGHNFGLRHDRYVNSPEFAIYPYAFGYTNKRAFEPGAPDTSRWRTIMAYGDRCNDAGFGCNRLFRFSNPDQTHQGDPLGVPADDPTTGPDGPADARLTINKTARWVGSFRSEACTDFTVSPETPIAPVGGGEVILTLETAPGCLWEISSQADFLTITSEALSAGSSFISIEVEANGSGAERNGTLKVAGQEITLRQLATDKGVCGRTSAVMRALTNAAGFADAAQCDEVTDEDLGRITSLDLRAQGISSLKEGDFEGLSRLERLRLNDNELSELPKGLIAGLSNLIELRLTGNRLTDLPERIFAGISDLKELHLNANRLTDLPEGIFAGLSNLELLQLDRNQLTTLPERLFDGLLNLEDLQLHVNPLTELPAGLFSGLSGLQGLTLAFTRLTHLPSGLFDGLSSLKNLDLVVNQLTALPVEVFAGLSNLQVLRLEANHLTDLPVGIFAGLEHLNRLDLGVNDLTGLRTGLFSGLTALQHLDLRFNDLTSLPPDVFFGLTELKYLNLSANELTTFPADIFSGLTELETLFLGRNHLIRLPDGVFSGLTALKSLDLRRNTVDPVPLSLSLEKVKDSQFKAVVPAGAPFALVLPVSASGAGKIEGAASTVTIPAGAAESMPLGVTRVAGTEEAVNVDLGTPPNLPANHFGYTLEKDETLPLEILPGPEVPPPGQVTGVAVAAGAEQLAVSWVAVSDAGGYKVQWKSGEEDYDEERQAVLAGGDTASHTITELTAGTEYTVRVIATKDNADDGPPSSEVTGIPTSSPPGQVTGVAVAAGAEQLAVSWVAVSDAGGYKVQRKSGEEDYDEERQAVLAGGDTVSHTITELTAGTEYTVRVIATKDNADDGPPSSEVTGIPTFLPTDATLISLSISDGTLTPAFAADTTSYTALVANAVSSITVTPITNHPDATVAFLDADDQPLADADTTTDGHQVNLSVGENTIKVKVTFEDATATETYTLVVTRDGVTNLCFRTAQVRDAILAAISGVDACVDVSEAHLSGITSLSLNNDNISALQVGDFSGLTGLTALALQRNALTTLPAGVFDELSALTDLQLHQNDLSSLPAGVFDGLSALTTLDLKRNALTTLPAGVFDELSALTDLQLHQNDLSSLPAGVFDGLSALTTLDLKRNALTTLPAGVFDELSALTDLQLHQNDLSSLPAGVFDGLSALTALDLKRNALTTLPAGIFSGLTALAELALEHNATNPLPLTVSLEKVGTDQFKAVAPAGAPFSLVLPVSISSVGEIEGGASTVTIPAGSVESASLQVTREAGTEAAVTVDIGTLPALPADHTGYVLEKDATLPLEILPEAMALLPAQVMGVEVTPGVGQLDVSWTVVSDAGSYKVQWKSGEQAYAESRQTVIPDGDTVSHTIAELTGGTEYTVRVFATRDNADNGSPSAEVMATPTAVDPDVNGDGLLNGDDALVMYHAYASASQVGDGETGGTAQSRQALLVGYSGTINPTDDDLKAMIRKAHGWREAGVDAGGDINEDGAIDESDALEMYYAYESVNLVGDGEAGGSARFRQLLLAAFASQPNPSDEDLKAMLRRANALRDDVR